MNLDQFRREYLQGGLKKKDLAESPIVQFEQWLAHAIEAKIKDPTAMTLATVNVNGQPRQRIVLLKQVDQAGFVFFTNYGSNKARDIQVNSNVSLHFPWHMLDRQVKITGQARRVSARASFEYFKSRPRDSQLAAWASEQSRPLSSRQLLMSQFQLMSEKFQKGKIPLPGFWGGFRVVPQVMEFWQGGGDRLHDRFEYTLKNGDWNIQRLAP